MDSSPGWIAPQYVWATENEWLLKTGWLLRLGGSSRWIALQDVPPPPPPPPPPSMCGLLRMGGSQAGWLLRKDGPPVWMAPQCVWLLRIGGSSGCLRMCGSSEWVLPSMCGSLVCMASQDGQCVTSQDGWLLWVGDSPVCVAPQDGWLPSVYCFAGWMAPQCV